MSNQLFLNAPTAMLLIDPINNHVLAVNQLTEKMFNESEKELLSKKATQLFPHCIEQLHLFTQQVFVEGSAWTNNLSIE